MKETTTEGYARCPWCGEIMEDVDHLTPIECIDCGALVRFEVSTRSFYTGEVVRTPEEQRL